jgi:hypothetical protein
MQQTISTFLNELVEQLRFISLETNEPIKLAETSIAVILKSIEKLKSLVIKHKFRNQQEEITFFKKVKPLFVSKLIYHQSVYEIETLKPHGGVSVLKEYFNNELLSLKKFFDKNLDFYKYHRKQCDYLDHKYFVRGKHDIKLNIEKFYCETDHRFSTSHDFKVAKIIANDQLEVYLKCELANIENHSVKIENYPNTEASQKSTINWTGSKASLIELLYAFHADGSFNNGNVEVKQIAEFIENSFSVELGQYSRTFLELRARKTGRTKYLDTLKEKLIKRMDDADDLL